MSKLQFLPKHLLVSLIVAITVMLVHSVGGGGQVLAWDQSNSEVDRASLATALPMSSGQETEPDPAELADIIDIARAMGTDDLAHVQRHLEIQEEIDSLREQLRAGLPESIAAVGLDALPETRVYVYVTRDGVEKATAVVEQSPWAEITEVVEVELSWNDLVALQESVANVLEAQQAPYAWSAIDFRENQIEIGATADQFDRVNSIVQDRFPDQRISVIESAMIERTGKLVGGLMISPNPETDLPKCTTGFNVLYNNERHVTTAGHCYHLTQNSDWLYHRSHLEFINAWYDLSRDIQLHKPDAFQLDNTIRNGANYAYQITGVEYTWNMLNDWVCKQGAVTGKTCGNVNAVGVRYLHQILKVLTDPMFVSVCNPNQPNMGLEGDSGAPVFDANNKAYGWVTARASNCFYFWPVEEAAVQLGIQVATTPAGNKETLVQGVWRNGNYYERTVPIYSGGIGWSDASDWTETAGDKPAGLSGSSVAAQSNYVFIDTVYQELWTASGLYKQTVPIINSVIVWENASSWSYTSGSNYPGSGSFQSFQNIVTLNELVQGFWRNDLGYIRKVPISGGIIQWGNASSWSAPQTHAQLNTPGSGTMQSQSSDGSLNSASITQGIWRGDQGWVRNIPVVNGVVQWHQAGSWSGPMPTSSLPGTNNGVGPQAQSAISH